MLSCEELNGQYVLLQQRCSDQGVELAQARAEHQRAKMELAESQSKVSPASDGGKGRCFICLYRLILWSMRQSRRNSR